MTTATPLPTSVPEGRTRTVRVAYLVSRFPHLPETFVLREMDRLERDGIEVVLCPLLHQRDEVTHPAARPWIDRAIYTPFVSPTLLRDLATTFLRRPRAAAAGLLAPMARVATTPNFLVGTAGIVPKVAHLARVLEARGIDHVHAHFATHPAMAAYALHRLTGIPYSFTVHAHDLYVHTAMLDRKLAHARFVVTISDHNRRLLERFPSTTPVHVIRSGIDLARYPVRPAPRGGPFTVLAIGSLQPYKGFPFLIDAVAQLRDRGREVHAVIVGGGPDHAALRRRVRALRLEGQVQLVGPQPEEGVRRWLGQAHAFVLPSVVTRSGKMEGLPVVLIEALASGLPTVATAVSGISELIRDGDTGLLVPPEDPAAIAGAIARIADDPAAARAAARRGRAAVEHDHDLSTNVGRLATLFATRSDP